MRYLSHTCTRVLLRCSWSSPILLEGFQKHFYIVLKGRECGNVCKQCTRHWTMLGYHHLYYHYHYIIYCNDIASSAFRLGLIYILVTRRLEKHSILKFICFKLLGHCNIFTFLLIFFIFNDFLCVSFLIDHVYISSAFDFWHDCVFWHTVFSICFLAFTFWHTLSV